MGDHQKAGGDSSIRSRMSLSTGITQTRGHPIKIKVQLVMCAEDGREEVVQEAAVMEKEHQRIDHLGVTLVEAKHILKTLQHYLREHQAAAFVAAYSRCDHCGTRLGSRGQHTRTFCTLFGTVGPTSPRLDQCRCQHRKTMTLQPLYALLSESRATELLLTETRWASPVASALSTQALKDFPHSIDFSGHALRPT
jgi:hypothetical protein